MVLPHQSSTQSPTYRIESVYAGSVDPFNSLPIPTNPEVDYLVRYCRFSDCQSSGLKLQLINISGLGSQS